jgi:hypothetical protein
VSGALVWVLLVLVCWSLARVTNLGLHLLDKGLCAAAGWRQAACGTSCQAAGVKGGGQRSEWSAGTFAHLLRSSW